VAAEGVVELAVPGESVGVARRPGVIARWSLPLRGRLRRGEGLKALLGEVGRFLLTRDVGSGGEGRLGVPEVVELVADVKAGVGAEALDDLVGLNGGSLGGGPHRPEHTEDGQSRLA